MKTVTLLGLFAATCTTIAFLPQVIKAAKTKHTKDISLGMYCIMLIGVISWFLYGLLIHNIPVIIANAVTFLLVSFCFRPENKIQINCPPDYAPLLGLRPVVLGDAALSLPLVAHPRLTLRWRLGAQLAPRPTFAAV